MITTTHQCDRCQKTVPTRAEIYELKLSAIGGRFVYGSNEYAESTAFSSGKHWCEDCLVNTGFFAFKTKTATPPEPLPSLEDMIREIVRSELPAYCQE